MRDKSHLPHTLMVTIDILLLVGLTRNAGCDRKVASRHDSHALQRLSILVKRANCLERESEPSQAWQVEGYLSSSHPSRNLLPFLTYLSQSDLCFDF